MWKGYSTKIADEWETHYVRDFRVSIPVQREIVGWRLALPPRARRSTNFGASRSTWGWKPRAVFRVAGNDY
eukprot:5996309-Heterocapsa_arctica.AAC.1